MAINLLVSSITIHVRTPLLYVPVFIIVVTIVVVIRGICVTLPLSHHVPANWVRLRNLGMVLQLLLEHKILLGELNVHLLHSGFQLINVAIPLHYGGLPLNEGDVPLPQGLLHVSVLVLQGLRLLQFYL